MGKFDEMGMEDGFIKMMGGLVEKRIYNKWYSQISEKRNCKILVFISFVELHVSFLINRFVKETIKHMVQNKRC